MRRFVMASILLTSITLLISMVTLVFFSDGQNNTSPHNEDILDTHVKNILVPRVSGTAGNVAVRQYIIDTLKRENYFIELDEFNSTTPLGRVPFANIIASSNPNACRQLVLACHYDSKLMPGFLGATDSAVPCAMLLKMSRTFSNSFRSSDRGNENNDLGLRFIFFDGEEAFVEWSSTDSLYGSRHLATKWARQQVPPECRMNFKSELSRIELFVLLDLIGTSDTTFVRYTSPTRHHYEALQQHENAFMAKNGINRRDKAFRSMLKPIDWFEDDHVPFKRLGVPILLLLAHPFPKVWHTVDDNYQAIDFQRTKRILHALEEFVSNYPSKNSD